MKELRTLRSSDGYTDLQVAVWKPEGKPVAIVQIIHGMCEHIDRYADIAEYLNQSGILVAGDDHIGHGYSSKPEDYGYFGETNGWKKLVEDEEGVRKLISEEYPGTPYVIWGHSMGSFILRAWLAMYGKGINGAIIMGTAGSSPALGIGLAMTKFLRKKNGSRAKSDFIDKMAFGAYMKGIENPIGKNDWISHDENVIRAYDADPMCGFSFTLAGYEDLFRLLKYINSKECYEKMPKELCYLIASGLEDPVGNYAKGVLEVRDKMEKAGCTDVSQLLYEGMRHEPHNEIDKQVVYEDIRDFTLDMAEEADGKAGE